MYRHPITVMIALIALLVGSACDDGGSSASAEESHGAHKKEEGEHAHEHDGDEHAHQHGDEEAGEQKAKQADQAETVEVPKKGKKFDPSVKVAQLPEGAWHCNMNGKSHYAAMTKGDGKCPVCNMKLKKAGATK